MRSARRESSRKIAVTSGTLTREALEQESDRAAKIIVEFLLDQQTQGKLCKGNLKFLFEGVIPALTFRRQERGPRLSPADIKDAHEIIAYRKPDIQQYRNENVFWIQMFMDWVAGIAYSLTRNTKICALVLDKAKKEAILRFTD